MATDFTNLMGRFIFFKNLTHLDINDHSVLKKPHAGFEALVALTHLCLVFTTHNCDPVMDTQLISNEHLQVLAFHMEDLHRAIECFMQQHGIVDRQIVLLPSLLVQWD
jgi:hypothetical protein